MYTEYEEKKGFPIRNFLIKLVLIIIFVLLLLWLLPIPNMKGINNTIFNANVQTMKDAAITYFTNERLPQNVGDKVTLTLQEMLDLKLLLPFTDKNGNTCDVDKSYVTLEKQETEYLMTVHLKCKDQEDEIVVHLGCYSYCTNAICEKKDDEDQDNETAVVTGPSCSLMVSSGKAGENGWYVGNVTVKFKSKTTTNGAKITNYGIGVTNNYDGNDSYNVTQDGITKVYGYIKDSNGKIAVCSIEIKKDTVAPSCNLTVLSGSTAANGSYTTDVVIGFKSKTDATSGVASFGLTTASTANYNGNERYTVSKNGTTKVYGYVKDAAGHTQTCDITVTRNASETTPVSKPSCSLEVTSGTIGLNNWYTSNVVVGFKTKTTTNGASIVSYGIGTTATYGNNTTYTVSSDGTYVVNGYVKDSNGNTATCSITIKKDATKPACNLTVLSGTKNSSGNYTSNVVVGFTSHTDTVSGINAYGISVGTNPVYNSTDQITITNNGTHTITGYVKDNAGNTNVCSIKITKVELTYEWEYAKKIEATYSSWGDWVTKEYDPNNAPTWGLSSDGLSETKDLGSTTVTKYQLGDAIYKEKLIESNSVAISTCVGYTYYRSQTDTTVTYAIKVADEWVDRGMVQLPSSTIPTDTLEKKYELVDLESSECDGKCTTLPGYTIWKIYTRDIYEVTDTYTLTGTRDGVTVECTSFAEQTLKVYNNFKTIVGYEKTLVTTTIYQYQVRSRSLLSPAYTDKTWSSYNNSTLINQGYTMTGNYRLAS